MQLTPSQSILKDLLKAQELQHAQVHRRVESKSSLVWSQSGVELHTVAAVNLHLVLVVFPDNAELDDTLGDGDDFQGGFVFGFLFEEGGVLESADEFFGRLVNLVVVMI